MRIYDNKMIDGAINAYNGFGNTVDGILNTIVYQPIGLANKNYTILNSILSYTIGSLNSTKVNYFGDPRGAMVDIDDDNKNPRAWFFHDGVRQHYSDYIAYIEDNYYYGRKWILDFATQEDKVRFFNPNEYLLENNKIGVVRGYNFNEVVNNGILLNDVGYTNPNGYRSETRLGIINNFYLNNTLQLSDFENQKLIDEFGDKKITVGGYGLFGLHGLYGVKSSVGFVEGSNGLRKQSETSLVDDIVQVGMNSGIGYYSSIEDYLTLINQTNNKNKNYLIKSLLGFDLLDEKYYTDINDLNSLETSRQSKKYRPTVGELPLGKLNYLNTLTQNIGFNESTEGKKISYFFDDAGNDNLFSAQILWEYAESEGNKTGSQLKEQYGSSNLGVSYGKYYAYSNEFIEGKEDLIYKTNKNFQNAKYKTLIARFHTDEIQDGVSGVRGNNDLTNTAISQYGMSKGRNLLKRNHTDSKDGNGYSNPYCRVWTYHHQYKSLEDTIRPFDEDISENEALNEYRANHLPTYLNFNTGSETSGVTCETRCINGTEYLNTLGVKGKNGLVKFTPFRDGEGRLVNKPQQCMFSIENLAWKGLNPVERYKLEEEQIGPLGGRIMWFPPYDLKFSENVSTNWGQTDFIGRGEHIYTYTNTERTGNLSFKLLVDHPSIINSWRGIVDGVGDVDDVESTEQTLLRFFAGCEMLDGKKKQVDSKKNKNDVQQKNIMPDEEQRIPESPKISFVVYFPNNYSGVDDRDKVVNPIHYLLNGYGTNRYEVEAIGWNGARNGDFDYSIDMTTSYRGYEMSTNGITVEGTYTDDDVEVVPYRDKSQVESKEWYYRVDNRTIKEKLYLDENYKDAKSYKLNSDGYQDGLINTTDKDTTWCSFKDFYLALESQIGEIRPTNKSRIIKELLDKHNILQIEITGYASQDGTNTSNQKLAKDRADTISWWLKKYSLFKNIDVKHTLEDAERTTGDISDISAKKWRSAKVDIYYSKESISEIATRRNLELSGTKTIKSPYGGKGPEEIMNLILSNNVNDINLEGYKTYLKDNKKYDELSKVEQNWENAVFKHLSDSKNNKYEEDTSTSDNPRYQDEYLFFSELEKNEPFLHHKLVEKIKYFDPAFHSITPEGFQSRLTFLHQCTRQGGTHSNSDVYTSVTADNLSFGRPPICVLRIGDFYYTKILIKSINIKYDDATWDLNDEGIGVMPMMANIDISFVFIGGSDLGGPITRLQNAVSFNYYANTAVYDNRAEMVNYQNGEINDFRQVIMDSDKK